MANNKKMMTEQAKMIAPLKVGGGGSGGGGSVAGSVTGVAPVAGQSQLPPNQQNYVDSPIYEVYGSASGAGGSVAGGLTYEPQPSGDAIAGAIELQSAQAKAKAKAKAVAISNLPIYQLSGSSIAHDLAESAAASSSGQPPNIEGQTLTVPKTEEGSPGGEEGSPEEEGSPGGSEVLLVPSNYKIRSFVESTDKKKDATRTII